MYQVFISYSRDDESLVADVIKSLNEIRELEIWQDVGGKLYGIPYSVNWFKAIERAIYSSYGAIIFNSKSWKSSAPCKKEYDIIDSCCLPKIYIDLYSDINIKDIQIQIEDWFCQVVKSRENFLRQKYIFNCYRFSQGVSIYNLINNSRKPKTNFNELVTILREYKKFKNCDICINLNFEIERKVEKYVKRSLFEYIKKIAIFALVLCFSLILIISILYYLILENKEITVMNNNSSISSAVSKSYKESEWNPLMVLNTIVSKSDYNAESDLKYNAKGNSEYLRFLLELSSRHYPCSYIDLTNQEYSNLSCMDGNNQNNIFYVNLNFNTNNIEVNNKENGESYFIEGNNCITNIYLNKDNNFMIYSEGIHVYIVDLMYPNKRIELSACVNNINKVGIISNYAFVVTDNYILKWELPYLKCDNPYHYSSISAIFLLDSNPCVLYTNHSEVYMNKNNKQEKILSLQNAEFIDAPIAISNDKNLFALAYKIADIIHVNVVDMKNAAIVCDYVVDNPPTDIKFSSDDKKVLYIDNKSCTINSYDIENKDLKSKILSDEAVPFSLITCNNCCYVADDSSWIIGFTDDLRQISDWNWLRRIPAPTKSIGYSQKYNSVFTANRGGEVIGGNARLELSNNKLNVIVPPNKIDIDSTLSVSLSDDGEFVIYGHTNGLILIYNAKTLDLLYVFDGIYEGILSACIADDNVLYVLGQSGCIYKTIATNLIYNNTDNTFKDDLYKSLYDNCLSIINKEKSIGYIPNEQ